MSLHLAGKKVVVKVHAIILSLHDPLIPKATYYLIEMNFKIS